MTTQKPGPRSLLERLSDENGERQAWFVGKTCSRCKIGRWRVPNSGQWSYVICPECGAIQLMYIPMPHQEAFHRDGHRFKAYFGGYGSGKTRTGAEEITRHILSTPRGQTLIGAQNMPQLNMTAKDMFFKVFPDDLIEDYNKSKEILITKNGHIVLFRPLDDEGKIRSLNLTAWWIEEASEVSFEIFVQLKARLRNKVAKHRVGILTSNPDLGWIRTEFLLKSARIENAEVPYHQEPEDIHPAYSSFIAPTRLNYHLPDDYIENVAHGKPEWWKKRYLEGSFEHTEGAVYPKFAEAIIEPVPIPKHWPRYFAADFGLRDPTAGLVAAVDPRLGEVHLYREHYEAQRSVEYHASRFKKMLEDVPQGRLMKMVGDPKGASKSEKDMRSLFENYAEHGIYFERATNKILDGIFKVYNYFEKGRIKIHSNCRNLIREGVNYKYKPQELDAPKNADEKPVDKDNHLMDCMRYIFAELPDNPDDLINPSISVYDYWQKQQPKQDHLPHALRDDRPPVQQDWLAYY